MSDSFAANRAFLENIFRRGPMEGHGFLCNPNTRGVFEYTHGEYTLSDKPVSLWVPEIVEDYQTRVNFAEQVGDDTVPLANVHTATHIYAAAFGCSVHYPPGSPPCAIQCVNNAEEADAIEEPDIWTSPTLYRIFEMADAVRGELGPGAFMAPPDMQTGFDTAALVWEKSDFLMSMHVDPDAVKRLAGKCASLLKRFLIELRKEFPQMVPLHCPFMWCPPDMGAWVSNDECGAMNNDMFREFLLPELFDLSETFGGFGMHCCADADHQFPLFREIPGFYGFNRVAGKKGWEPMVEEFTGNDAPVFVLGWVADEQIEWFLNHSAEGARFIFVHSAEASQVDEAKTWYEKMRRLSPRTSVAEVSQGSMFTE